MADTHTGTCFCGAVAIEVTGVPAEMGYCHCNSCRSYSGGPVSAFKLWKEENVKVTKGAEFLGRFRKTEMTERRFCTKCGGHVMAEHPSFGFTSVYAATIPTGHCHGKVDRLGPCAIRQRHAADLLCAPPVSCRDHPACHVALPPVHVELP